MSVVCRLIGHYPLPFLLTVGIQRRVYLGIAEPPVNLGTTERIAILREDDTLYIYDIYSLAQSNILSTPEERALLRKCIVFYSTLGNPDNPHLLKQDVRHILKMPFQDLMTVTAL